MLDALNDVSSSLLELVPWRAREGIDKMVTEDNERYRSVNDTITQKVEEIDAAILRSQQVTTIPGLILCVMGAGWNPNVYLIIRSLSMFVAYTYWADSSIGTRLEQSIVIVFREEPWSKAKPDIVVAICLLY